MKRSFSFDILTDPVSLKSFFEDIRAELPTDEGGVRRPPLQLGGFGF